MRKEQAQSRRTEGTALNKGRKQDTEQKGGGDEERRGGGQKLSEPVAWLGSVLRGRTLTVSQRKARS